MKHTSAPFLDQLQEELGPPLNPERALRVGEHDLEAGCSDRGGLLPGDRHLVVEGEPRPRQLEQDRPRPFQHVVAQVADQCAGRRELPSQPKVETELGAPRLHLRVAAPRECNPLFGDRKPAVRRMGMRCPVDDPRASAAISRQSSRPASMFGAPSSPDGITCVCRSTKPVTPGRYPRARCATAGWVAPTAVPGVARPREPGPRAIDRAHSSPSWANCSAPSSVWNAQPPGRPIPISATGQVARRCRSRCRRGAAPDRRRTRRRARAPPPSPPA